MEIVPAVTPPPARPPAEPFRFCTSFILPAATGLRAATLPQLAGLLKTVPDSCVYYHTHYFLLAHHYLTPTPTNDFAYWVRQALGEEALGELLAGVDTMQYDSLQGLRAALVVAMDGYLERQPMAKLRFASEGEEFFFIKAVNVVLPTHLQAATLEEFAEAIAHVSLHCLYYHIFDARLRLGRPTNDFALWLEQQVGPAAWVREVAELDPYAHTLEELRAILLGRLAAHRRAAPS